MEKYGYNIVVDIDNNNDLAAIEKIAESLGVENNEYGDFYCYDKTASDIFLNKVKSGKLAERIFVYEGKESEDYTWKLKEIIEPMAFTFEGNDNIEKAVIHAASVLTDEYFIQNGKNEIADNHNDEWYNVQEELRKAILESATNKLLGYFMIGCF